MCAYSKMCSSDDVLPTCDENDHVELDVAQDNNVVINFSFVDEATLLFRF